jgi:hypothetical protein
MAGNLGTPVLLGDISAPAGTGGVAAYTFASLNGDTPAATTATSAAANVGVVISTAAAGEGTDLVLTGKVVPLLVNGNSTNIAVGDFIAPTTAGYGIENSTNRTAYNAIALQAATTDAAIILVKVEYGVIHTA